MQLFDERSHTLAVPSKLPDRRYRSPILVVTHEREMTPFVCFSNVRCKLLVSLSNILIFESVHPQMMHPFEYKVREAFAGSEVRDVTQ